VNIFENGWLNEFRNAQNNQNICVNINPTGCLAAEKLDGIAAPTATTVVKDFANLGLAGQVAVPIMTAAFTGSTGGSQFGSLFHNSTLTNDIINGGAGSFANSIGTGGANFTSFLANMIGAGFPSNFFVVNPTATGGAFAITNGAQSTYNALIVDLRHRPSHGLQFDLCMHSPSH